MEHLSQDPHADEAASTTGHADAAKDIARKHRQGPRKRLGEMLVEAGLLTQQALDDALVAKRGSPLKLGQFLIQNGIVEEARLLAVLSRQLKVKRLDVESFVPDPSLASLISSDLAERCMVLPLARQGGVLWVAMQDPTDLTALDSIMHVTRMEVEIAICSKHEFDDIAHAIYGRSLDAGILAHETFEEIEEDGGEYAVDEGEDAGELNIGSLQSMAQDAPVVKIVNSILVQAMNKRASDIHFSRKKDKLELKFRIDGELKSFPPPPKKLFLPLISRIKLLSNLDISVTRVPQDGRFTYRVQHREISVRVSTLPTIYGEKVVMRLHVQSAKPLSLDQLGMSDKERVKIDKAILKPYGMMLATGPTGSGKTTLLYSILKKISKPTINTITLEDPVESRIDEVTQVQLNVKAGMTFASGLRAILRQDPDVVMVGEIRDQETANIGIQASMTGHKVLSTLHTNDAAGAVTRFIEMDIEPFLIASTLLVVVAQRLVRRICPDCIEPFEAPAAALRSMGVSGSQRMHFFQGKGCFKCENSGFKGRMGVYEVLEVDDVVQPLILKRASSVEIKQAAVQAKRLSTLKMDAAFKVFQGLTTFEEFTSVAF
ncbi:putative type II secretion system protein E [Megalodesulfovibrio gigas DSM 1382 = ATCC 19364]|uniref:Putative type II secretion system protein E n=2 Tax=Megalodesulfovibrio gigas TaxID=879 RepID=T2G844_MEGG1|nr:putative type II secretion system protein E [Megalodesulfovibrio gigas DSM 1382 = ATCC 19364]